MNIEHIKLFVENKLGKEASGHDYLHALRVYENAVLLASNLELNTDVIYISALIHDLIDHKLEDEYKVSIEDIEHFLENEGVKQKDINHIVSIINNMSYSSGKVPDSIEGQIVQDADRLDALGAIGIARTFAYGGKNNRLIYNPTTIDGEDSVSHFYQKLFKLTELMNTETGKIEAKKRTSYMMDFIKKLNSELNN